MKSLVVTDKQLQVIKEACELYGRIQIGQFERFAEIVTQTGFSGWELRVQPEKNEGETDEQYKARCERLEEQDRLVCKALVGSINGIYREIYNWNVKDRTNESSIALDLWGFVDGRRDAGCHMGSEPLPKLLELDGDTWKEMKQMITDCGCLIHKADPRLDTEHPLTMNDLMTMVGEPVWNRNLNEWLLVKGCSDMYVDLMSTSGNINTWDEEELKSFPLYRMRK